MKAIVFGGTGFIGSHVVEQLVLAKHSVTVVVRPSSNLKFLKSLGVAVVESDFSNVEDIANYIKGHEVVYNCVANPRIHQSLESSRVVEVELTRKIAQAAAVAKARRFIQLSTIKVYGYDLPKEPIDENYPCKPKYPFEKACLEREQVVQEVAKEAGLDFVILRPASTIGGRDVASFFSTFYKAHKKNSYPIIGNGKARFSCVDTRDIGRAMVWLGDYKEASGQIFLLKGFDIDWLELKDAFDKALGVKAKVQKLPRGLAMVAGAILEQLTPYSKDPLISRLAVESLTTTNLYNDSKLRNIGFSPKYGFEDSVDNAIAYLNNQ